MTGSATGATSPSPHPSTSPERLKGRVALITGSSNGTGTAVAELGARFVVNSVSSVAEGEQLAAKLADAMHVQAVSDPASAKYPSRPDAPRAATLFASVQRPGR
jgi:NAD(P)-dependent dehydrogenase (short-subunit alcohol dehydrogenase family)